MKRKIIGHRGVAGLELENSATSLTRARTFDVRAVEIDVRLTKDKKLVLCHDNDMTAMTGRADKVGEHTLAELRVTPLLDGSRILTLREGLELLRGMPIILDVQSYGCARLLLEELQHFPDEDIKIASRSLEDLVLLRDLAPHLFLYKVELTKPVESIHTARLLKLDGIGFYYWLLNPLTYWYARYCKLSVYVFTVNNRFILRLLETLYPDVQICSDHPERFVHERRSGLTNPPKKATQRTRIA